MRKVLLITGELYPINSGAGLHTYGYCNMISKHCEFYACSLYYDEDEAGAERIISKDFNARLVKPYLNKTDKLKNMARIAKANFLFMYPVYKRMHETIVDIIKEKKIDTLIIDHVTMGLYFYKLRKEYPSLRFIYNSHNVEYVNIYDRHIRFLKGDKFKGIRRGINQIRYRLFRKIEKDMLESTFAVFDISKADIDMLKEEYRLSQSRMYLAKPLSSFKAIKTIDSISTFKKKLLIVGSMGWYPNVNGIIWFVEKVFSKIIKEDPEYKLYLVGRGAGK